MVHGTDGGNVPIVGRGGRGLAIVWSAADIAPSVIAAACVSNQILESFPLNNKCHMPKKNGQRLSVSRRM